MEVYHHDQRVVLESPGLFLKKTHLGHQGSKRRRVTCTPFLLDGDRMENGVKPKRNQGPIVDYWFLWDLLQVLADLHRFFDTKYPCVTWRTGDPTKSSNEARQSPFHNRFDFKNLPNHADKARPGTRQLSSSLKGHFPTDNHLSSQTSPLQRKRAQVI